VWTDGLSHFPLPSGPKGSEQLPVKRWQLLAAHPLLPQLAVPGSAARSRDPRRKLVAQAGEEFGPRISSTIDSGSSHSGSSSREDGRRHRGTPIAPRRTDPRSRRTRRCASERSFSVFPIM